MNFPWEKQIFSCDWISDDEELYHPPKRRKGCPSQTVTRVSDGLEGTISLEARNVVSTSPKQTTATLRVTYGVRDGLSVVDNDRDQKRKELRSIQWQDIGKTTSSI